MAAPSPITLDYMGARPGSFMGSISASSTTLTLTADDHGFLPGERVIVETGGEADGGELGTVGVGGVWPERSFADLAALVSFGAPDWVTSAGDPVAWLENDGTVRYWDGNSWEEPPIVYARSAIPLALRATVDAVDGAVITLSVAATVSATNARVWVDNRDVLEYALENPSSITRVTAGEYAVGDRVDPGNAPSVKLFGDGASSKFLSPRGCRALRIHPLDCDDIEIGNLSLQRLWTERESEWSAWNGIDGYGYEEHHMLHPKQGQRAVVHDITMIDPLWGGTSIESSDDPVLRNISFTEAYARRQYMGWSVQLASCTDGLIEDCSGDSDSHVNGFELFQSTDCEMRGLTGRNAVMALNSNVRPVASDVDLTFTANSLSLRAAADPSFTPDATSILSWNRNFSEIDAEGGQVSDFRVTIEGDPGAGGFLAVILKHQAIAAGGEDMRVGPGVEIATNGYADYSINAFAGGTSLNMVVDGVETDAVMRLRHAEVSDTSGPEILYCSDNVTLGSGNNFDTITDECA